MNSTDKPGTTMPQGGKLVNVGLASATGSPPPVFCVNLEQLYGLAMLRGVVNDISCPNLLQYSRFV